LPAQIRASCLTVTSFVGGANKFFCKQVPSSGAFLANPSSGCCSPQASPPCQPGFTGLRTVCRFPVLCRFAAPTSCCLWQGNALRSWFVLFSMGGLPRSYLSSAPTLFKTPSGFVCGISISPPPTGFSPLLLPFSGRSFVSVVWPALPPVSGKCVTASGPASAPGTKPGTSRDERMMNSSSLPHR